MALARGLGSNLRGWCDTTNHRSDGDDALDLYQAAPMARWSLMLPMPTSNRERRNWP